MRTLLVLALGLLAAASVAAQEPADTLDLAAAIALARAYNPRIAGASAEVAAAGARIGPAGAWPDPTLTIGAMNYMLPGLSPRGDVLTMNQVTLMQTVPVNGVPRLRRAAARADSASVAWGREALALDIEHEVRTRYWELYHTDRALETMRRTLGVLRDLASIASAMYAVGTVAQADVVRAQAAVTRMEQQIADMELQRTTAAAAMDALMGRDPERPIVLRAGTAHQMHGGEVTALEMPPLEPLDSLVAAADSGNFDLAALRSRIAAARANEAAARRLLVPDLGVGLAYGQRAGSSGMVSAMVGVSLPIFARARQLRQREEARAVREAGEDDLAAKRLEIRTALATARAEAETARRQVALYGGALVPQAAAAYESALAAYRVGRVDFTTVLDARMSLLMDEHDAHRFEALYGTAIADIDRLVGRLYVAPMAGME